jgi:hypothetical protein
MDYFKLDEGSYFVNWGTVFYNMRANDREATLHATRQADDDELRRLLEPCLEGARGEQIDERVAEFVKHWDQSGDPETPYAVAPILLVCGRTQEALRFVERAVEGSFCSYPALDLDPIWAPVRNDPEFLRIRAKARACHDRFRSAVVKVDAE